MMFVSFIAVLLLFRAHFIYNCCSSPLLVRVCAHEMNSSLRQISMYPSDRQKWKKLSSHCSPPSWLASFFHRVSLQ